MYFGRPHSSSRYVEFARIESAARFNLATSALMNYPLRDLKVRIEDLEINGPGQYGYAPLQERLARLNGTSMECVVQTMGTSMANHLAMASLFEPGEEVLIEEPVYEPLLATALFLGARVHRFPRRADDGYRIDAADVARSMTSGTRLIVMTNLHNPSGAVTDENTLRQIGEIGRSYGARVLVDEVYLDMLFGQPKPRAHALGDPFVVTGSLTKAYGLGGLRCGWILAPPDLARHMWRLNDLFGATPVHVAELLSVIALDQLPAIARRAEELVETNRSAARELLGGSEGIELSIPPRGTLLFPQLKRGTAEGFCRFLREEFETSVAPGHFFESPKHFRIGLGGDPAMTREGLTRLDAALHRWNRGNR